MRDLRDADMWLDFTPIDPETRKKFEIMDKILKSADRELDLVLADLTEGVDLGDGRPGMSAEQVLRMAIVLQMYDLSYEQLHARVDDSNMLRKFCRYEFKWVPKASALQENIQKLRPETLAAINRCLVKYANKEGIDDGRKVRIDTTAVETHIHHPTDRSLIWDGVRVLTRMLRSARSLFPDAGIVFHNRTRVVKKRVYAVANAKSGAQRVKLYRELAGYAEEVLQYARNAVRKLNGLAGTEDTREAARAVASEIKEIADLLAQVIDQTRRRVFKDEKVPAEDKVVSLFDPETDIIEKGGRRSSATRCA